MFVPRFVLAEPDGHDRRLVMKEIDVPVTGGVRTVQREVTTQAAGQPARTQGAANVEIVAGREFECAQPANLDWLPVIQAQNQGVCARAGGDQGGILVAC